MFGYVMAASELLNENDAARLRGWYCGLCRALGSRCGQHCRLLLAFDMTFLAMTLSSVYRLPETVNEKNCLMHPMKKHAEIFTEASGYAADMNVLLAYHKLLDDWSDDKNPTALLASYTLKGVCNEIIRKYPRQANAVTDSMRELAIMEQNGELNPDIPANCFGRLMGELFVINNGDVHSHSLRRFGYALGKFVYAIDAAADLLSDIKHKRYNPLVSYPQDFTDEMLLMLGGNIMNEYSSLDISSDRTLIENVLTAGIWVKYRNGKNKDNAK